MRSNAGLADKLKQFSARPLRLKVGGTAKNVSSTKKDVINEPPVETVEDFDTKTSEMGTTEDVEKAPPKYTKEDYQRLLDEAKTKSRKKQFEEALDIITDITKNAQYYSKRRILSKIDHMRRSLESRVRKINPNYKFFQLESPKKQKAAAAKQRKLEEETKKHQEEEQKQQQQLAQKQKEIKSKSKIDNGPSTWARKRSINQTVPPKSSEGNKLQVESLETTTPKHMKSINFNEPSHELSPEYKSKYNNSQNDDDDDSIENKLHSIDETQYESDSFDLPQVQLQTQEVAFAKDDDEPLVDDDEDLTQTQTLNSTIIESQDDLMMPPTPRTNTLEDDNTLPVDVSFHGDEEACTLVELTKPMPDLVTKVSENMMKDKQDKRVKRYNTRKRQEEIVDNDDIYGDASSFEESQAQVQSQNQDSFSNDSIINSFNENTNNNSSNNNNNNSGDFNNDENDVNSYISSLITTTATSQNGDESPKRLSLSRSPSAREGLNRLSSFTEESLADAMSSMTQNEIINNNNNNNNNNTHNSIIDTQSNTLVVEPHVLQQQHSLSDDDENDPIGFDIGASSSYDHDPNELDSNSNNNSIVTPPRRLTRAQKRKLDKITATIQPTPKGKDEQNMQRNERELDGLFGGGDVTHAPFLSPTDGQKKMKSSKIPLPQFNSEDNESFDEKIGHSSSNKSILKELFAHEETMCAKIFQTISLPDEIPPCFIPLIKALSKTESAGQNPSSEDSITKNKKEKKKGRRIQFCSFDFYVDPPRDGYLDTFPPLLSLIDCLSEAILHIKQLRADTSNSAHKGPLPTEVGIFIRSLGTNL